MEDRNRIQNRQYYNLIAQVSMISFLLFLIASVTLGYFFTREIASQIHMSVKNNLILGNNPDVVVSLTASQKGYFKAIAFYKHERRVFIVTENATNLIEGAKVFEDQSWRYYFHRFNNNLGLKSQLVFAVNPLHHLALGFVIWVIFAISTAPFWLLYKKRFMKQIDKAIEQERNAAMAHTVIHVSHDVKNLLVVVGQILQVRSWNEFLTLMSGAKSAFFRLQSMLDVFKNADIDNLVKADWHTLSFNRIEQEMKVLAQKVCAYLKFENNLKEEVKIDSSKIDRALLNLVGNALESGAKNVLVKGYIKGSELNIEVWDDGPGVPGELLPNLFKRGATFGKEGGTGLGLAYVQAVARGHGGDVTYRREEKNTVFSITIPGAAHLKVEDIANDTHDRGQENQQKIHENDEKFSNTTKKRLILICCDDDSLLKAIKSKFINPCADYEIDSDINRISEATLVYSDSSEIVARALQLKAYTMLHRADDSIDYIADKLKQRITIIEANNAK